MGNLFFVSDGVVRTPAKGSLLPGITRETILEIADAEGLEPERGRYTFAELREATEAFLTNSTWELRPVASVDGVEVGGGPTTSLL